MITTIAPETIPTIPLASGPDPTIPFRAFRIRMSSVPMTSDQFFDFCQQNSDLRIERTAQGDLILMPPTGGESSSQNLSLSSQLYTWWIRSGKPGKAFDSSGGFELPNGATRSPDSAWLTPEQIAAIAPSRLKKFVPACPHFAAELLSPTDSRRQTQEKMQEYLDNGTRLGWLLDPDRKQVHVYRPGRPVEILDDPKTLAADPEVPGFVLDVQEVWQA